MDEMRALKTRMVMGVAACATALAGLLLGGCSTPAPQQVERLVWPAPPQPPRVQFVRSIYNDEDVGKEANFDILEFIAGKKPPANRIAEPMALAVSDDGNRVYVSDYAQLAVFVFDFQGKKFTRVGKDAALAQPFGIALDGQENLYVVEQEKKGVSVFARSGERIRFFTDPSLERPSGIAIDRLRGKIYVADTAHTNSAAHTVKIFDTEGKLIGKLGDGKGPAPGQFTFPTYVSVDADGNVYVTDTLNSRIQKFDPDGKYVRSFGERGNGWGMFDKPKGVATDSFGNVYVVDSGWSNVQIFNQKGQVLLFFGGRGPIPGMLQNPSPIAIDKKNRIYVGDYLNHRVEVYELVNTNAADSFVQPPAPSKGGATVKKSAK